MKTFRVVCTKNPSSTIIDFAAADNAANSLVTHDNLLKLRQYETPKSTSLLPSLMLTEDDNGKAVVNFEKPERASDEQHKLLEETKPRILASYNKFKYSGQNSTLQITEENMAVVYSGISSYDICPASAEEENFRKMLERSQRKQHYKEMQKNSKRPSPLKKYYNNGD